MVDVGNTLLYTFFGVLQVYIYFSQGMIIYYKGCMRPQGLKTISALIFNFFIPVYSIVEISRVSTFENLNEYWILAILTFVALCVRIIIMKIITYFLDIDQKIKDAFSTINAFPALGSLTLIIGNALCYPSCPLYGDPLCDNILGLMMIIYLINILMLFIAGLIIMSNSKTNYNFMKEKLKFMWYYFITTTKREDMIAKFHLFKNLNSNDDKKEQLFSSFKENNKLIFDSNYKYYYYKNGVSTENIELSNKVESKSEINKSLDRKNSKELSTINNKDNKDIIKINSCFISIKKNTTLTGLHKNESKAEDIICKKEKFNSKRSSTLTKTLSKIHRRSNSMDNRNKTKKNALIENYLHHSTINLTNDNIQEENLIIADNSFFTKQDRKNVLQYYNKLFDYIEEEIRKENAQEYLSDARNEDKENINFLTTETNLVKNNKKNIDNVNKKQIDKEKKQMADFNKDKIEFIENIVANQLPMFFPVDSLSINRKENEVFNKLWIDFNNKALENKIEIELKIKEVKIDFKFVLSKLFNPPVICCILGLFIGISGLRDVLFSDNHYLNNIYQFFYLCEKCFLPLLCVSAGYSLIDIPSLNLNFSMTSFQILISFVVWVILFPIIGIGKVVLFRDTYAGIIETSKVFRYSLFVPYCLPVTSNLIILINIVDNYYLKEFSMILNRQTFSLIILQTLVLLIFFVWIG